MKISSVHVYLQVKLCTVVRIHHLSEKCKGFFKSIHKMVLGEKETILYKMNKRRERTGEKRERRLTIAGWSVYLNLSTLKRDNGE